MKFTVFLCLLLCSTSLLAQNKGKIKGVLYSSEKEALEKATVAILLAQDSTVLSYSLSNENGKFSFIKLPLNQNLILYISHINATAEYINFNLSNEEEYDFKDITLAPTSLEEVVIEMTPPIRMNKDTLEYNAKYFKTRPNANVEELLQKLPGLQVNLDGSIYYQGKAVQSVRLNNKDFFNEDMTIATRNLDASMIDKVQVFREKGESKQTILDDTDLPVIINLKTKREFVKAQFGKFYAGGGTRDRYEAGALVNTFRDTLQISFIGYANNLSRKGFDYSELSQQGGFGRAENNSSSYSHYGGLQNNLSGAVNINYDIAKKLKTNFLYSFEQQNDYTRNVGNNQNFYNDTIINSTNFSKATYKDYRHKVRAFARYHLDTTSFISYDLNLNLNKRTSDSHNESSSFRNESTRVQWGKGDYTSLNNSPSLRHNFRYEKKFSNKWVLSLSNDVNISNSKGDRNDLSYGHYYLLDNSIIDQHINEIERSNTQRIGNTLNLQIPYKKLFTTDIYAKYNIEIEDQIEDIYSKLNADYFEDKEAITNDKKMNADAAFVGTKINYRISKRIRGSIGVEWLNMDRRYDFYGKNEDIQKTQNYWLPNISLNVYDLNLSYSKGVNLPSFYQFVAVDSDLYPTTITYASPYFDNEIQDNLRIQYFKYFQKLKFNLSFYGNYTVNDRSIGNRRFYDVETSTSTSQYYQAEGTDRFSLGGNFRKEIIQHKTWNIYVNGNYNFYSYPSINITNGIENRSNRNTVSGNQTLNISWKNKISISPSYNFNVSKSINSSDDPSFRNIQTTTHDFGAGLRLSDIHKITFETSYNIKNQPSSIDNARKNIHLVNASVYYPVMGKGELKLTVFDLLNQNQNVYRYSSNNYIGYGEQLTQKQYFMLGFVYKFLTSSDKNKK